MGKQSSRIYFGGGDHKEVYFQRHYHDKMYIGNELVWEKLKEQVVWKTSYLDLSIDTQFTADNSQHVSWYGYCGSIIHVAVSIMFTVEKDLTPQKAFYNITPQGIDKYGNRSIDTFFAGAGYLNVGQYKSLGTPGSIVYYVPSIKFEILAQTEDGGIKGFPYIEIDNFKKESLNQYCNTEQGWHVFFSQSGAYISTESDRVKSEIYINDVVLDYTGVKRNEVKYYADANGTIVWFRGSLYTVADCTKWSTISTFFDFDWHRVVCFQGQYLIADSLCNVIAVNGDNYVFNFQKNGLLKNLFVKEEYLYLSFSNGDLVKTKDLQEFTRINIGREVFGCVGEVFLATSKEVFSGTNYPLYDAAYINF